MSYNGVRRTTMDRVDIFYWNHRWRVSIRNCLVREVG